MGKKHRGKKIIASNIRDQRVDRDSKKNTVKETEVQKKKSFLSMFGKNKMDKNTHHIHWLISN